MAKRKVVVIGAAGYIAGRMLPALRERYDLTLLDIQKTNREGEEVEGVVIADLVGRDREAYRKHFVGADAVIHCGWVKSTGPEDEFLVELDNIMMAYNVYQISFEEGVRRVVVMSSNHAADYYSRLIWADKMEVATPDLSPLSDNFYGWGKAAYELLGFAFATGASTGQDGSNDNRSSLQNVQIRIGAPRETDIDRCVPEELKRMHRALGAYLSVRDQVQLVVKSIETEDITEENGVPFQIFYGISGNTHNFWSIANARKVIGYSPEDNSQVRFADKIGKIIREAQRSGEET